ncbi:MAG: polysaccharide biosynthesis/export family protein [Desulfobaccales bacterium]|nr:polysaccharide biosynthesis/export family protein [Desulfobaccales bacterium]
MNLCKWLVVTMVVLSLAAGCAASAPMSPEQALTRMDAQAKKKDLNEQIFNLGARSALKGSQDYQVGPEDLLEVSVYGETDLQRAVRVNGQGMISLPLVGAVKVAGLTPAQAESKLAELYGARYLKDPQVAIFVKEYRHQRVALTGALKTPGFYELIGPRSLLEMLAMAGGLDDKAGDKVQIIRPPGTPKATQDMQLADSSKPFEPNSETIVIDMRQLLKDGTGKLNFAIRQGDVINVPFAGNAYVLGSVNKPGNVPVKKDLTVTQAVAMAGGTVSALANPSGTTILRMDEQGQAVKIPANLSRIVKNQDPDIILKEQDVVFVPESAVRKLLMDVRTFIGGGMSVGYAVAP